MKKIGYVVWWSFRVRNIEPDYSLLVKLAEKYNIRDELPEQIGIKEAVVKVGNGYLRPGKDYIIKPAQKGSKTSLTYAVLYAPKEKTDDKFEATVKPTVIDRLHYRKEAGGEMIYLEHNTDIGKALEAEVHRLVGKATQKELRKLTQAFLEQVCQGIPLRRTGGIYFVPVDYEKQLMEFKSELENWSEGIDIYIAAQYEDSKATYGASAKEVLLKEILELHSELKELAASVKTRRSTFERRLNELKALKEKVIYYSEILQVLSDELMENLKEAEQLIIDNL